MKIKQKKQLTLPQLIEWAMDNDMHDKTFRGDRYGDAVHFDENEDMLCVHVSLNDLFTVEVEEEITEDTVIPKVLEVYQDANSNIGAYIHINRTINSVIEDAEVITLHIINDDGTHTLIWTHEKGLVE